LGNKSNCAPKHKNFSQQNEVIEGPVLAYELRKIMRSYFPNLQQTLQGVPDHRKRKDYAAHELLFASLGMFIFKAKSRNAMNNDRRHSGQFTSNFQKLFKADLPTLMLRRISLRYCHRLNWRR
jgi:hypothetical protein